MRKTLKLLRTVSGLNQIELAEKMNIAPSYISYLEDEKNRKKGVSQMVLEAYSKHFKLNISALYTIKENIENKTDREIADMMISSLLKGEK